MGLSTLALMFLIAVFVVTLVNAFHTWRINRTVYRKQRTISYKELYSGDRVSLERS